MHVKFPEKPTKRKSLKCVIMVCIVFRKPVTHSVRPDPNLSHA